MPNVKTKPPLALEIIERVFAAVIELESPAERAAFLDRECGPDRELRAEIESLLESHDDTAFLSPIRSLAPAPPSPTEPGPK